MIQPFRWDDVQLETETDEGTMSEKTHPIENIVQTLAEMCCEALNNKQALDQNRVDALVQALVTNGWERHSLSEEPLQTVIEKRIKEMDRHESMYHSEQVVGMTERIEHAYKDANQFQSSTPENEKPLSKRNSMQSRSPRTSMES